MLDTLLAVIESGAIASVRVRQRRADRRRHPLMPLTVYRT
jgi:hypothetical protein